MEILFVLTHGIMFICLIAIIGVSILNQFGNDQTERSAAGLLSQKDKLLITWKNVTPRKELTAN